MYSRIGVMHLDILVNVLIQTRLILFFFYLQYLQSCWFVDSLRSYGYQWQVARIASGVGNLEWSGIEWNE